MYVYMLYYTTLYYTIPHIDTQAKLKQATAKYEALKQGEVVYVSCVYVCMCIYIYIHTYTNNNRNNDKDNNENNI